VLAPGMLARIVQFLFHLSRNAVSARYPAVP
jgi:hypothetical protein